MQAMNVFVMELQDMQNQIEKIKFTAEKSKQIALARLDLTNNGKSFAENLQTNYLLIMIL